MAKSMERTRGRITASEASVAVRHGRVTPLFQPIEALQTGACQGLEALARLTHDGVLVAPHMFLGTLNDDDRLCLFGAMLGASIALLKNETKETPNLYVSINVEVSLLVSEDFDDILRYFLDRYQFAGERLVLEILETEEVVDMSQLRAALNNARRFGISIALDDIGSGYASLTKLRDLPIDILKLDRSFSRDLEMHPEDLTYILSISALARALDKRLVVEGIETAEVYDALRVMGVDLGQGYGIAPPMPADNVASWLAARITRTPTQRPNCLLGAYASHLTVVEACRLLQRQPLPIAWTPAAKDHENCVIGHLFGRRGWHATAFGEAHRRFHEVLPLYNEDQEVWTSVAAQFQQAMAEAISAHPGGMRCDPVSVPGVSSGRTKTTRAPTARRRSAAAS